MPVNKNIFLACVVVALAVCAAQVIGSTMLILACLAMFMVLSAWACVSNYTLPLLLFFLPWSQILKTDPTSFSFYTFAIVMICFISVIKKQMRMRPYHIVIGFALIALTLVSKLMDGSMISMAYLAFMMLIVLFPVVTEESKERSYDLYTAFCFFAVGVVMAALCAQQLTGVGGIARYIRVDSYLSIRRACGFYSDPNFYTAQITAALGAGLVLILREREKVRTLFIGIMLMLLVYCGMLSGSKSFVVVLAVLLLLWVIELVRLRGRAGLKTFLIVFAVAAVVYIASSALFSGLIAVLKTRFSFSSNISDLTTGRTELWMNYLREFYSNPKLLLLGKGMTNVKLNGRASHSTVVQMVFQLGVIGSTFLLGWVLCFFSGTFRKVIFTRKNLYTSFILIAGSFMPWLAIDALYFDEFFLLQWFVLVGLQHLQQERMPNSLPANAAGKKQKRQRIRFVP